MGQAKQGNLKNSPFRILNSISPLFSPLEVGAGWRPQAQLGDGNPLFSWSLVSCICSPDHLIT